jgi:SAM-dependent methyltransferase
VYRVAKVAPAAMDALFEKNFARMAPVLLGAWTGSGDSQGQELLDAASARLRSFELLLPHLDVVALLPREAALDRGELERWISSNHVGMWDLESVLDVNIILSHLEGRFPPVSASAPLRVLEIGGGYGRLAEAIVATLGGHVRFLLVDAVPATLVYAFLYLCAAHPTLRVGFYAVESDLLAWERDPDAFHIFVLSAWEFEVQMRSGALDGRFHASLNVQSMQEMDQWHVDFFIESFNRATVPGGIVYNSNSRRWIFRGRWDWPQRWGHPLFNESLPGRSWTKRFETLVFGVPRECHHPRALRFGALDEESCGSPPRPAGGLWWALQFEVDNRMLTVVLPPHMTDLEAMAAAVCEQKIGDLGHQCVAQLLSQALSAAAHVDREDAQVTGLHSHAQPFSAWPRAGLAAEAAAIANVVEYCGKGGEGGEGWRALQESRLSYACAGHWRRADPVRVGPTLVLCVHACEAGTSAGTSAANQP